MRECEKGESVEEVLLTWRLGNSVALVIAVSACRFVRILDLVVRYGHNVLSSYDVRFDWG